MLTIFSIPKPFEGHIGIIQRNAVASWRCLDSNYEIILYGDEKGTKEVASEFNAKYLPEVDRNKYGTPLLSSVFSQVRKTAINQLLCYVNTDIILMSDFKEAVKRAHFPNFLLVGQRWEVEMSELWNFENPSWEEKLRSYVDKFGNLGLPCGIDYFVFPRDNKIVELPPFAVGRPGWDNWFIYKTRSIGIPVIDITKVVTAIHQNHDHTHVLYGRNNTWEGPEAEINRKLMGRQEYTFSLLDATHILTSKSLKRACTNQHLRRYLQTIPILFPRYEKIFSLFRAILRCLRPYRK